MEDEQPIKERQTPVIDIIGEQCADCRYFTDVLDEAGNPVPGRFECALDGADANAVDQACSDFDRLPKPAV